VALGIITPNNTCTQIIRLATCSFTGGVAAAPLAFGPGADGECDHGSAANEHRDTDTTWIGRHTSVKTSHGGLDAITGKQNHRQVPALPLPRTTHGRMELLCPCQQRMGRGLRAILYCVPRIYLGEVSGLRESLRIIPTTTHINRPLSAFSASATIPFLRLLHPTPAPSVECSSRESAI